MTEWDRRVSSHPALESLENLKKILRRANELIGQEEATDPEVVEAINRLQTIETRVTSHLDLADPALVPVGPLNSIDSHLKSAISHVETFIANQGVSHLRNANDQADSVLERLGEIPVTTTPKDVEGLRESITSYRHSAAALLQHLGREADEVEGNLKAIEDEIATLEGEIREQRSRVDTALTQQTTEFNKAQTEREKEFTEEKKQRADTLESALTAIRQEHERIKTKWDEALRATHEQLETRTTEIMGQIEERLERAQHVVGIIEKVGTSGEYLREANADQKSANYWYVGGFFALAVLVVVTIWVLYSLSIATEEAVSNQLFIAKLFASVTVAAIATYILRIAGRRRRASQSKRKIQLELATLEQYLEPLAEDEQRAVLIQLVPRYFSPHVEDSEDDKGPTFYAQVQDLLRRGDLG